LKPETSAIVPFIKKINGDYWLPAIQRQFVWKERQVCQLFDSIMRGYPIGSLLVWETDASVRRRYFVNDWDKKKSVKHTFTEPDAKQKRLVLDGQQRLQSLMLGLRGSMNGKSLHFNAASDVRNAEQDIAEMAYEFGWFAKDKASSWNWVSVRDLLDTSHSVSAHLNRLVALSKRALSEQEKELVRENLGRFEAAFHKEEAISFALLSNVNDKKRYRENDVVEIFVRANAGGTKLQKSELLFALLSANWTKATERLEDLASELDGNGFKLSIDYCLKACLVLLDKGAQYDIQKFREPQTLRAIQRNWKRISEAIADVIDFVPAYTPIADSKSLVSRNALLPLIALRYHHPKTWTSKEVQRDAAEYLMRSVVTGAFNGAKDDLIDALSELMVDEAGVPLQSVIEVFHSKGRSTSVTPEKLWQIRYGSPQAQLVLRMLRPGVPLTAANRKNLPEVDHLFSQKVLAEQSRPKSEVDQLANLTLLSAKENKRKSGKSIHEWLENMSASDRQSICTDLLIPSDESLWKPGRFGEFIRRRKQMILQSEPIRELLAAESA
jgi:hypothetical protein